jgi:hypothetical protein
LEVGVVLQKLMALFRREENNYEDEERDEEVRDEPRRAASEPHGRRETNGDVTPERKRRHVIRHNCEAVVEMQMGVVLESGKDWSVNTIKTKARVLDLSMQGCAVFTKKGFEEGQKLRVLITVQDGTKITGEGVACWNKHISEKNGHATGVQFTKISPADLQRVAKFLTDLEKTLGL